MQKYRDVLSRWERKQLSAMEAGELLGCSERQFRRYRRRYEEEGLAGLVDRRLCKADRALRRRGDGASRPDRGQPDAVLATVKAWPGDSRVCGERVATASLDGDCARRPGARAGRDMA
jgi:hypothetical protein